jgi:hypothetical protein
LVVASAQWKVRLPPFNVYMRIFLWAFVIVARYWASTVQDHLVYSGYARFQATLTCRVFVVSHCCMARLRHIVRKVLSNNRSLVLSGKL